MKKKDGNYLLRHKIQMVPITLAGLIASALNGIIAYIAVYFFKPLWDKTLKWFQNK
jgi:ABC-type nickel/cobalt efflux system permease component RcnA